QLVYVLLFEPAQELIILPRAVPHLRETHRFHAVLFAVEPRRHRLPSAAADAAIKAARAVDVDIAALQVSITLAGVETRAPVQDAGIVEHHQLAIIQPEANFVAAVHEQLAQTAPGALE